MATALHQPSRHYATQAGLSAAFLTVLRALWARYLHGEVDRAQVPVQLYATVTQFANASAVLAARDYAERRAAAGIRGSFTVPHAEPPGTEQFRSALYWSLTQNDKQQALEGSLGRLVLQPGRETVIEAVSQDRQARAWARETRGNCCSFCAMLATRGAVYRTEQTASFEAHNHCHCVAVPVFGAYEQTAEARQWTQDWYALKERLGHTPSLNQWRQSFEGRPVKGLPENVPQ